MEALIEIILRFVGELLLQLLSEALTELIARSLVPPSPRAGTFRSWSAAIGIAILGSGVGAISLVFFPAHFIKVHWLRIVNLVFTPIVAGLVMAGLGILRQRKGQELIRLDSFSYGFCFAFAMALVRFIWGR